MISLSAGFGELNQLIDVAAATSIAQILSGAGLAVGLIFVLYHLGSGSQKGYVYLMSWLIAVLFYITFLA